jgi:hypothetical protein
MKQHQDHQSEPIIVEYKTIEEAIEKFTSIIKEHENSMSKDVFAIHKFFHMAISITHPIDGQI